MLKDKTARALYLELAAHGVCFRTGRAPVTLAREEIPDLLARVQANRAGLRAVLLGNPDGDGDLDAIGGEGRTR